MIMRNETSAQSNLDKKATLSAYSKFEVSNFIRYEHMNGGAKCGNRVVCVVRGHSWSSAMSPFDKAHMTSYSTVVVNMCLSYTQFYTTGAHGPFNRIRQMAPISISGPIPVHVTMPKFVSKSMKLLRRHHNFSDFKMAAPAILDLLDVCWDHGHPQLGRQGERNNYDK